jgi:hypothetical protein
MRPCIGFVTDHGLSRDVEQRLRIAASSSRRGSEHARESGDLVDRHEAIDLGELGAETDDCGREFKVVGIRPASCDGPTSVPGAASSSKARRASEDNCDQMLMRLLYAPHAARWRNLVIATGIITGVGIAARPPKYLMFTGNPRLVSRE